CCTARHILSGENRRCQYPSWACHVASSSLFEKRSMSAVTMSCRYPLSSVTTVRSHQDARLTVTRALAYTTVIDHGRGCKTRAHQCGGEAAAILLMICTKGSSPPH
ncbi:hypothetical protein M513_12321, partial [Trichuris suis]